jgi:hypothetical protein
MSTITVELYDALISAGAPESKAKLAAQTVSAQEHKLSKIEMMITGLYIALGGFGVAVGYMFSLLNTIITKLN